MPSRGKRPPRARIALLQTSRHRPPQGYSGFQGLDSISAGRIFLGRGYGHPGCRRPTRGRTGLRAFSHLTSTRRGQQPAHALRVDRLAIKAPRTQRQKDILGRRQSQAARAARLVRRASGRSAEGVTRGGRYDNSPVPLAARRGSRMRRSIAGTGLTLLLLALLLVLGTGPARGQRAVVTTRRCGLGHERVGFTGFLSGLAWQVMP